MTRDEAEKLVEDLIYYYNNKNDFENHCDYISWSAEMERKAVEAYFSTRLQIINLLTDDETSKE